MGDDTRVESVSGGDGTVLPWSENLHWTVNTAKIARFHFSHSFSMKRCVILALSLLDEFFCGRWEAVCYWRTVLGNRWEIWD